jgi:hypothetical protein
MDIKILVAYHKNSFIIKNDIYLPIQVGSSISNLNLNILKDNEGDNISYKNNIYCELTAAYWAWKNLKADYIGLCHYRRFLTFSNEGLIKRLRFNIIYLLMRYFGNIIKPGFSMGLFPTFQINNSNELVNNCNYFENQLKIYLKNKSYDIVTVKPLKYNVGNVLFHFRAASIGNIDRLELIVKTEFEDYYPFLQETFNGNELYYGNIFLMKYDIFCEYCNFIFSILKRHEEETLNSNWCRDLNEGNYSRISGYLGELLTDTFIRKCIYEKKKILKLSVLNFNESI